MVEFLLEGEIFRFSLSNFQFNGDSTMRVLKRTAISKFIAGVKLLIVLFLSLTALTISAWATTIYVDDSNVSGIEDGTPANPYDTIEEGMAAAATGDSIFIAAGSYLSPGDTLFTKPGLALMGAHADSTIIHGDVRDTTYSDLAVELHRLGFDDFVFWRPTIEMGNFSEECIIRECGCENIFISHGGGTLGDTLGPIPYFHIIDNEVEYEIGFKHGAGIIVGENIIRDNSAQDIKFSHGAISVTDIDPIPDHTYLIEDNVVTEGITFSQGSSPALNTNIVISDNEADLIGLASGWGHTYIITGNTLQSGIADASGANWTTISGNTILNGRIIDVSGGFYEGEDQIVENNTIYYQATGKKEEDIAIQASSASVTIRNNTIECTGACSGVELKSGWPTNVIDNEITLEPDESGQTFGIDTKAGGGVVTQNVIQGAYVGYVSASGCTLFADNEITGAHTGFISVGAEEVSGNVITGCTGNGMILNGLRGPIHGNVVTDNDSAGIVVTHNVDLGGGADGCVGGNIIQDNGYCDLVILWEPAEEETLFVQNNIWDHDTADDILAYDICNDCGSGLVTIDFSDFVVPPDAPSLLSPADGILDAGLSPQLQWHASANAEHYWLQVAEDSGFAAKAADTSGITDTTFTLTGLSPDTEYFWRVAAGNLAGYGDWSEAWRFAGLITIGLSVEPDSLGFGQVPMGGDSSLVFHIKSIGTDTLKVSDINSSHAVFSVSDTAFSLAPAESTNVTVTFAPAAAESYSGTLAIRHNAAGGETVVPLNGTGALSKPVVLSMVLSDPSPTRAGPVNFTLTFDRTMDTAVEPTVSYGLASPYDEHTITAAPGWSADSTAWTGTDTIGTGKGDGLNRVKIQSAQDPDGRVMNPDTGRTFFIDTTAPISSASSPLYSSSTSFTVRWSGADPFPASGVAGFAVFVSVDGGPAAEWIADTTVTAAVYAGSEGHFYSFYSLATDSAGNREMAPGAPQCSTSFDLMAPQITATTIWTDTSFGGPFAVSAEIEDSVGIGLALLWYRTAAETVWQADTMTAAKDLYAGAIPEQSAPNTAVSYYVHARDLAEPANSRTDPAGAPGEAYAFTAYVTAVEPPPSGGLPGEFVLQQNVPNPFNAGTRICYTLPRAGRMRLEVFNILGQRVAVLADGMQPAGAHAVRWDGRDHDGQALSSGVYLCRLSTEEDVRTRKMVLLR